LSLLPDINSKLQSNNKHPIELLGVTVDNDENITSFFTKYGQHVPTKQTPWNQSLNVKKLDWKYYPNIDRLLIHGDHQDNLLNNQVRYSAYLKTLKNTIYQLKTEIAEWVSNNENAKRAIIQIVENKGSTKSDKINKLYSILKRIPIKGQYQGDLFLKHIANEITDDNEEFLLLNNIVTSDTYETNQILRRDSETVLFNIKDIFGWVHKNQHIDA
jgi:hypothetical protein